MSDERADAAPPAGPVLHAAWLTSNVDPYRAELLRTGEPDLERILQLLPRPAGPAAFDGAVIAGSIERLRKSVDVRTAHPFLDLSVLTGLAYIDATFQGNHPKYGVGAYAHNAHDGFPPTVIAAVDALSAWGLVQRAQEIMGYWLTRFVREDGTIDYYGPALSEYGQLLHTAVRLCARGADPAWWQMHLGALRRLASWMMGRIRQADGDLVRGCPEADEAGDAGRYFHNNAWLAAGLACFDSECRRRGDPADPQMAAMAAELKDRTLDAIAAAWPADPADYWLVPQVEPRERPHRVTASRIGSYTNYRYWPELLSSGILPPELAARIVQARLSFGGQFLGTTRFMDWLDDWPLFDCLSGLHRYGYRNDLLLSLYGHIVYHQAEGHLTAYEQVSFPPGRAKAAYCLPAQLVAARTVALLAGR